MPRYFNIPRHRIPTQYMGQTIASLRSRIRTIRCSTQHLSGLARVRANVQGQAREGNGRRRQWVMYPVNMYWKIISRTRSPHTRAGSPELVYHSIPGHDNQGNKLTDSAPFLFVLVAYIVILIHNAEADPSAVRTE